MASTVLAAIAATMLFTSMRTSWKSPFLRPAFGAMMSTKTLPTDEPTWFATLRPLSSLDLGDVEVLARHDLRGLAHVFDLRDGDEAALVVADDEGLRRIGAHVHLTCHHLLHREIAGRDREFLELDAALLERAGLEQIVGRHAPDVGLVALADGRHRADAGRSPIPLPARGASAASALAPGHRGARASSRLLLWLAACYLGNHSTAAGHAAFLLQVPSRTRSLIGCSPSDAAVTSGTPGIRR